MRSDCVLFLFAACFTPAVWGSILDIFHHEPRVYITRRNALLPCTCLNGVLDCSEGGKSTLTAEDVCNGSVTTLNLYDNELTAVPYGFREAIVVNISSNRLAALPSPSHLSPQIRILDVKKNLITNTSDELRSLGSLETLILSNNYDLHSLNFLPNPCALRHLEAVNLKISDVQGPLTQCVQLEILDLSANILTTLPVTFSALTQLRELKLGRNPLTFLSNQTFFTFTLLRRLELPHIGLRTIPDNLFGSLPNLELLNLKGNKLKSFTPGIFSSLPRLSHLNLVQNPLESFPIEVTNVATLEELNLGVTELSTIPDNAFSSLPRIKDIQLFHNNISSIPNNAFSGLAHLQAISLGYNPMTSLPEGVFSDSVTLKFLMLPCIKLHSSGLRVARNATHVFYVNCGIIELSSSIFSELTRVGWLLVNRNKITRIAEDALTGLPLLQTLDLSENELTDLPASVFSSLPHLQDLGLMANRLTTIPPGLFSGLRNLKYLLLARNRLTELQDDVFHDLVALESLDLSINALTSVPPNLLAGLFSLKEVLLENNLLTTLPAYNPSWATVPIVSFSWNSIMSLDAGSLRPWLEAAGSLGQPRHLLLEEEIEGGASPASLHWLLREPHVAMVPWRRTRSCGCGMVRRGGMLVQLCVHMPCAQSPADPQDWLAAVAAAGAAANASSTTV